MKKIMFILILQFLFLLIFNYCDNNSDKNITGRVKITKNDLLSIDTNIIIETPKKVNYIFQDFVYQDSNVTVSKFLNDFKKYYKKNVKYEYVLTSSHELYDGTAFENYYILKGCRFYYNYNQDSTLVVVIDIDINNFFTKEKNPTKGFDYYGQENDIIDFEKFKKEQIKSINFYVSSHKKLSQVDKFNKEIFNKMK